MSAIYNFCAGPAMLPQAVMQKAQQELIDWNGLGVSVMEISHRSKEFIISWVIMVGRCIWSAVNGHLLR